MSALLVFAIILLAAVLLSGLAERSVLSTAVIFLVGGFAVPWVALKLEQSRFFGADRVYKTISAFAIAVLVLGISWTLHANELLAGFAAGVTIATVNPAACDANQEFGEVLTELFKLAALLVFGAVIEPRFLLEIGWRGYAYAFAVLLVVRPIALGLALVGSELPWPERATAV